MSKPDPTVFGPDSDGDPGRSDDELSFAEFIADIDREIAGGGA